MTYLAHCRCGHLAEAHEHFRPGDDCGACRCGRFDGVHERDASPTAGLAAALLTALAPSLQVNPGRP
ncbi:MAG: hypothetical protein H0X35_08805 [Pseudonocardiales bacterium]|nr:hypothetical protein [Pseudonocardiales bacterium]